MSLQIEILNKFLPHTFLARILKNFRVKLQVLHPFEILLDKDFIDPSKDGCKFQNMRSQRLVSQNILHH